MVINHVSVRPGSPSSKHTSVADGFGLLKVMSSKNFMQIGNASECLGTAWRKNNIAGSCVGEKNPLKFNMDDPKSPYLKPEIFGSSKSSMFNFGKKTH